MSQHKQDNSESWFSAHVEYAGLGKAYFEDPRGYIEGRVRVSIDNSHHSHIEMEIEKFESEEKIHFGLFEFLSNDKPYEVNGRLTFNGVQGTNPCTRLEIICSDGIFTTFDNIIYNLALNPTGDNKIIFFMPLSEFVCQVDTSPKFWVIPLINYIGDFQEVEHSLTNHLLRLRETPYPLITFELHDKQGFIEPLLELKEHQEELLTGKSQCLITAVMIGEIGDISIDISNFQEELPFEFIALLSLATGSKIGFAWIELRGSNGKLVKRLHHSSYRPCFSKGHSVIPVIGPNGTRHSLRNLLVQSQSSSYFGRAPLGPVISDLVESGFNILPIEDKLNRICRGFDHLCKHFGFDVQNLMNGLDLSNQALVKSHLLDASRLIRDLANSCPDASQSQILSRIADKTANSDKFDRNFGLAVVALLNHFGLPDAQIIDSHYATNPRLDGRESWSSVISYYRGQSVHIGYFELGSGFNQYDVLDLIKVTFHLHDILIRIVLKMLNYDSVYYSPIMQQFTARPVDWVQLSTSASDLGY